MNSHINIQPPNLNIVVLFILDTQSLSIQLYDQAHHYILNILLLEPFKEVAQAISYEEENNHYSLIGPGPPHEWSIFPSVLIFLPKILHDLKFQPDY